MHAHAHALLCVPQECPASCGVCTADTHTNTNHPTVAAKKPRDADHTSLTDTNACYDTDRLQCLIWGEHECNHNPASMMRLCPHTCGLCTLGEHAAIRMPSAFGPRDLLFGPLILMSAAGAGACMLFFSAEMPNCEACARSMRGQVQGLSAVGQVGQGVVRKTSRLHARELPARVRPLPEAPRLPDED